MATSLQEIRDQVKARVEELRPAAEEYAMLERASQALDGVSVPEPDHTAPYGRKADGTPRRRPGRKAV